MLQDQLPATLQTTVGAAYLSVLKLVKFAVKPKAQFVCMGMHACSTEAAQLRLTTRQHTPLPLPHRCRHGPLPWTVAPSLVWIAHHHAGMGKIKGRGCTSINTALRRNQGASPERQLDRPAIPKQQFSRSRLPNYCCGCSDHFLFLWAFVPCMVGKSINKQLEI